MKHLGYSCSVKNCDFVLEQSDMVSVHYNQHHQHVPAEKYFITEIETGKKLDLKQIYDQLIRCPFKDCKHLFCSNSIDKVQSEIGEHKKSVHGVQVSKCQSYQCMAGAEDGDVACDTVISGKTRPKVLIDQSVVIKSIYYFLTTL